MKNTHQGDHTFPTLIGECLRVFLEGKLYAKNDTLSALPILNISLLSLILSLTGCASSNNPAPIVDANHPPPMTIVEHHSAQPPSSLDFGKGPVILNIAKSHLGTPYRYGGNNPNGFDCSGLVQYTHRNAGISIPRTAHDQYKAAQPIAINELQPGDVIFFKQNFRRISHVGIYAGGGRFIHAPNSGKRVKYTQLNDPYWSKRIARTGRFY